MASVLSTISLRRKWSAGGGAQLFSLRSSDRNGKELCQGSFRVGIRKKLLTIRVVKHQNNLSGEVTNAPHLSALKKHLDNSVSNLL